MAEAATKEPSMEDILSSIRKIIAEEGGTGEAQAAAPAVEPPQPAVEQPPIDMAAEMRPSVDADVPLDVAEPAFVAPEAPSPMVSEMPIEQEVPADVSQASAETSLASIAASMQETAAVEATPAAPITSEEVIEPLAPAVEEAVEPMEAAFVAEAPIEEPSMQQEPIHVEMAEAISAPAIEAHVAAAPVATEEDMAREEEAFRGALMSPSADNAVGGSFERLKRSAMDDIEAKTEAVLRPMLREWLDENLPTMVERLVREEIERVARGS